MNIKWEIPEDDIRKVSDFVRENQSPLVQRRIRRNIYRQNVRLDRDAILRSMLMSLLTSQQRYGPDSPAGSFLGLSPFPLSYSGLTSAKDPGKYVETILKKHGLGRFVSKIPVYIAINLYHLEENGWALLSHLESILDPEATARTERLVADGIDKAFKGFGSRQARNFLQSLGLTKYEIPIDPDITGWLDNLGFPVTLSPTALQDRDYYHFVSDGIQMLCEKAKIYPCVLEAAIISSREPDIWTDDNIFY